MKRFIVIVIVLLAADIVIAENTRYVTDELTFALRTGKSTQHKIIRMLPSGLSVRELEVSDDGYSRVMTTEGTEGWILSRYLTIDPSAREQLEAIRIAHERMSGASEELERRFTATDETKKQLEIQSRDLQATIETLRKELDDLRHTAARPVELSRENAALQKQLDLQQKEIHQLSFDNKLLKDQSKRNWFLAGTGVTLGSLFLGLVIPRIPWRKRRGWSEL